MNTIMRLLTLWLLIALAPNAGLAEQILSRGASFRPGSPDRLVFANYMVAFPTYGEAVEDYKREIQEAQALGIDGFVLNVSAWSAEPYWEKRTRNLFGAALQLGTGFRLFLCADMCCGLSVADIQDMMLKYSNHPSYLRYLDRPLLTTFQGQALGLGFWNKALGFAELNGLFVPSFSTAHGGDWQNPANATFGNPTYAEIKANYLTWWQGIIDGLYDFAVTGLANEIASSGEGCAQLMKQTNKLYMAGTAPYFWEGRLSSTQPGLLRRYYETLGGEGIAIQWHSIISNQQPPWVVINTWNDYTESYMSPADPSNMPQRQYFFNVGPLLRSHAGYAGLEKYYIRWFKTGTQPVPERDALYYFYRTHPKDAYAARDKQNLVLYGPGYSSQPVKRKPHLTYGEIFDNLYITTVLTSPASLTVSSGGVVTTYALPAGLQNTRVPFHPGAQSFNLLRDGVSVIHKDGDPIDAAIQVYNFTTTSGFGYGRALTP